MNNIKTLVLMQLRDKIDLSWTKSLKENIHIIGTSILKFVLLTIIYAAVFIVSSLLGLVYSNDIPKVMTFVLTIVLVLSTLSCTVNLTKSLYFAEDNKVLITLPVSNNKIFISKLLVFFFYELKRSLTFALPIIYGSALNIFLNGGISFWTLIWMVIPTFFIIMLPVLLGALLSIPGMYIYRIVVRSNILKGILICSALAIYIYLFLSVTKFLPKHIDFINQWPNIQLHIVSFLNMFEVYNPLVALLTRILIGESVAFNYVIGAKTLLLFVGLVALCGVLFILCYFISRPLFFRMMSKNFEFNKSKTHKYKNKVHSPLVSFNLKEMRISFRSFDVSLSLLISYITIPLLILILNQLFIAMDKSIFGTYMSYAFNILLIVLPLLLSNTMVASLYSREGRTGYIKKTKPINPLMPLLSKLTFNLVACIPSIIFSGILFAGYVNICASHNPDLYLPMTGAQTFVLILAILLLNYAHIFYSARQDLLYPKNEEYATSGEDISNSNETKSAGFGLILALLYSAYTFLLFKEFTSNSSLMSLFIKLFVISLVLAIIYIRSYVLNIKAFYAQSRE